jgi:Mn-dependent transcriptional regulator
LIEPTHGLFKTEYQSCSKRPAGRWFSDNGRGWISPPDRHRPGNGEKIYERHQFFTEQLIAAGADRETAEQDACRMEHVISQESFEHLKNAYKTKE